ncbi:MAG TPA: MFS transporter [Acidimicrobiales bacterium]|nr:MFS transporter [Acidimicrobiales bacterium]
MLSSLRPLRSRNFALVWTAAFVSNIGSWMQTVVLAIVVTDRSHNPLWTGTVAAAAFVPVGVLSPVGGALADRLDRRRWLVTTTVAEAAFAATLAVLAGTGHAASWALVGVAFLGGVAAAIGFPTYQAMLPDLVPAEDLLGAVSLSSAQFNLGRVIGPALAGLVLVVGSPAWAFAVNALSFGAVVAALALITLPSHRPSPAGVGIMGRIVEGARLAAAEPGCRSAITLIAVVALIGSPFIALAPALAIDGLHSSKGGASMLVTAQGVGAVCGALVLTPLAQRLGRRLVVGALFAFPVALVPYGLSRSLWTAVPAMAVVGACYIGVLTGLNTVVQRRAPTAARGRVLGLYMMALGTIYPVGAVVEGAIAHRAGIRAVTAASGVLLLGVMAAIGLSRGRLFAVLDGGPVPAPASMSGRPQPASVLAAEAAAVPDGTSPAGP